MLPSELHIVSFRYITIYHLIFGYITLYTWTSAHPTYPSPYHDIMSTYEMRTRLIIVEGLPDSGKSTTAAMVAAELEARGRNVVCVEEGAEDHPADVGDYDFPDFASERATILDTWRAFAAHAEPDTTYVFNCVLLQNPMCETMMRFGMSEDESRRYISDIAAIIAPLHPVVIYIDEPGAKSAIDGVLDERGEVGSMPSSTTTQHKGTVKRMGCADMRGISRALKSAESGSCASYVHFRLTATSSRRRAMPNGYRRWWMRYRDTDAPYSHWMNAVLSVLL